MQVRRLGKQGPEISVVGYGAWEIGGDAYGPNPEEREVLRAIRSAIDEGMNWIDTAEVYGGGVSETLVGKAIEGRRDDVLVATKVAPRPEGSGFAPDEVKRAIKNSLKRMRIDHIDLYQLHWWPGGDYPIEETWATMAGLMEEGLTRFIGVSNFDREQIERCLAVGHVDSLQPQFSLLHRAEEKLIAWCGRMGIGTIAYGPLAYGLLTGTVTKTTRFRRSDWRSGSDPGDSYYQELFAPRRLEKHLEAVEKLKAIAEGRDVALSQLMLAWTFHKTGVTAAIAGSRNAEHNRENARAGDLKLTPTEVRAIQAVL